SNRTTMNWDKLVTELGAPLYRYFSAAPIRGIRSEDLVQEVFLRLFRCVQKGAFDPSKGTLRMFAFGIAHFVRLENLKSTRTENLGGDDVEFAALPPIRDELLDLRRAIAKLSEDQR